MRILHLAQGLMANLPRQFLEMERRAGHESDLVYFQGPADTRGWPTIPQQLADFAPVRAYRAWRIKERVRESKRRLEEPGPEDLKARAEPLALIPRGPFERIWYPLKDALIRRRIPSIIREFKLDGYDAVHFDGARDLNWSADLAKALKAGGARIVSVFYGTELRVEGVNPALEAVSDLDLTVEPDHPILHPRIHYVPTPFEIKADRPERKPGPVRIVHAPSDRFNKGTDIILPVIERLKRKFDFEFLLIEGVPQDECRRLKYSCDLCIDQVGNRGGTGYGVSSLETFAAGIACVSDFTPALAALFPGHPFYLANPDTLEAVLTGILSEPAGLFEKGRQARAWLEATHGYASVRPRVSELYARMGLPGY
jgi:hypothetical protein